MSSEERTRFGADVARLHADGLRVVDKQVDSGVFWGPEGKAWARRLEAEALQWRWVTGQDAPTCEELVAAWEETIALFAGVRSRARGGALPDPAGGGAAVLR